MGIFSSIFSAIGAAIKKLIQVVGKIVQWVVKGVVSLAKHVVGWFKSLGNLIRNRHIPFLADANSDEFRKMLEQAPEKNVGIFEGVYDEQTDEIIAHKYISADQVDEGIKNTLGDEPLVVLS